MRFRSQGKVVTMRNGNSNGDTQRIEGRGQRLSKWRISAARATADRNRYMGDEALGLKESSLFVRTVRESAGVVPEP